MADKNICWNENPSIWAVSCADTAQIRGFFAHARRSSLFSSGNEASNENPSIWAVLCAEGPRSGVFSCTHAAVIFSHQETKHGKQTTETFLGLIRPRWKVFRRNHRAFVSETREGGLVIFENGGQLGQDFGVEKKKPGSEMFAAALQFLWCQSADSCRHLMPAILRRKKAQAFLALNASTKTAAGPTTQ